MVARDIIYLSKAIENTTPKMISNINDKVSVKMLYQSRFIKCNNCRLVENVDYGAWRSYAFVGAGNMWEISVPS